MIAARAATDPPSLKFKTAACMYIFAHGGSLEVAADVASIGESTLRRWLHTFCTAIIARLKPIYMPCKPFSKEERDDVQAQFASRRGIPNPILCVCSSVQIRMLTLTLGYLSNLAVNFLAFINQMD